MAQLTVMNSDTVNPYNKFVKYHTGHAGSRTCSICRDRDGKIYPIHDAPLDHPNGLCWLSPVMSKDGKTELSLADMVDDMNDYFDGKPNSGVMTQWLGKSYPLRVEPKPQPKPQQPTEPPKATIPKGHLYTEEQREQKYQELETHLFDGISSMLETELVNNKNKDNMIKPYSKTTVKGIIGTLRKYPASIQDLYLHTLKDLKMNYTPDGAFYSPMTDSIHFSVKKTNNDNRGPYGTVFHEWGHMIDRHVSETGGTVTYSVKDEMYKILKQDVEDRIKYQQKNSRVKINKAEAKKLVSSELNGATDAIAGVSDIYGGVTGNAVVGRWGHAKSYWTRRDKEAEVCSEAWADILQSYGIPNQVKYIEKYMPGGKAFVEKTVEELIEKIKRGEIK